MAEKVEKKQFEKKSKLAEVFSKDYKYEGLILLVLALLAITLGTLITSGVMTVPENVFLIGEFPKVFAIILIVLGAFSLALSIWPYYKPSIYEVKRINWPSKKEFFINARDTFIFIFVLELSLSLIFKTISPPSKNTTKKFFSSIFLYVLLLFPFYFYLKNYQLYTFHFPL